MGPRLKRRQDWQRRLNAAILAAADRRFRYGRHDCCMAAARCVKAMTGVHPIALFGAYRGEKGAARMRKKHRGLAGVVAKAAKEYGLREIPVSRATGGDIVIVGDAEGGDALGIVGLDGRNVFAAARPRGWATTPLAGARRAYRIP